MATIPAYETAASASSVGDRPMKRIMAIYDTRPEAVKLAPVVLELRTSGCFEPIVAVGPRAQDFIPVSASGVGMQRYERAT
jgi:hypothetical protein